MTSSPDAGQTAGMSRDDSASSIATSSPAADDPFADRFEPAAGERTAEPLPAEQLAGAADADRDTWQVSLVGLLWLVTLAGVLFAAWPLLEPAVYAGAMGGVVLLGLAVHTWLRIEAAWWQAAWWLLLAIYLAASGLAVWRG